MSPKRPNILWIITDEQRCDSIRAYGSPWAVSPNIDRLAERGVLFRNAYTPSPVCVPARVSLLTGRSCSSTGVFNNHHRLPADRARFLTRRFASHGYAVASFGKQHYNCPVRAFDQEAGLVLDDRVGYWGYLVDVPEDIRKCSVRYPSERRPWLLAGRYPGAFEETPEMRNVRLALEWLQRRERAGAPFFLRVSFNAPHTPVVAPAPFDTCIDPERIHLPIDRGPLPDAPEPVREHLIACAGTAPLSDEQVLRTRQAYYGRTAFVDAAVGRLLDGISNLGLRDHTIVAFTSDHGCHLGDHGFYQKQSFYEASARVPCILAGPGLSCGRTIDPPVSIGSLLPTLLDLAGLPFPRDCDYQSLAEAACGGPPPEGPVFSEIDFGIWGYRDGDRYVMVRQGPWKLAVFRDRRDPSRFPATDGLILHDLEKDPRERRNLAHVPDVTAVRERLFHTIAAWDAARPFSPTPRPVVRRHTRHSGRS